MVRPCLPLAGIGICTSVLAPPCQMMRIWQVRPLPLPSPAFRGGDDDLGDDRADEFLALGVGGGRGLEDGPQVGAGGGDPGGLLVGEGDGPAGALGGELVFRGAHGRELVFQDGLEGPCHQPVFRLDVVVLAQRPAGFVTGAFGGAFEHGQVLAVLGLGVGHGLDGGGQGGRGERGQQLVQDRFVQPPSADPLAGPGAVHLVRPSAPVGGAAAGVVGDLHEPPAPAAAQQALQPGRAFPRGPAGAAGGLRASWRPAWRCWRRRCPGRCSRDDGRGSSRPTGRGAAAAAG